VSDKTWKAFERRVATAVGGVRHPVTGERAGADVESDRLVIQVKRGYTLPKYLRGWLQGMIDWRDVNAPGKIACVVWQKKGGPDKDALVFMRLEEFQQMLHEFEVMRKLAGYPNRDDMILHINRKEIIL